MCEQYEGREPALGPFKLPAAMVYDSGPCVPTSHLARARLCVYMYVCVCVHDGDECVARALCAGKLDRLRVLLPNLISEGHRVLLFSQWTLVCVTSLCACVCV